MTCECKYSLGHAVLIVLFTSSNSVVGGKSRRSEFLTLHFLFIMHVPSAQTDSANSRQGVVSFSYHTRARDVPL